MMPWRLYDFIVVVARNAFFMHWQRQRQRLPFMNSTWHNVHTAQALMNMCTTLQLYICVPYSRSRHYICADAIGKIFTRRCRSTVKVVFLFLMETCTVATNRMRRRRKRQRRETKVHLSTFESPDKHAGNL